MITISLCMIVKNEEKTLEACLESLTGLVDEKIIVDTGSTDGTIAIAEKYGAKVYHYTWIDDFADARNYAFSKCSCDYIYSADADEKLDGHARGKFQLLKENLDPRIDIVQMWYLNKTPYRTVYNTDKELRPKLFKRLRSFVWENPIHEQVRLTPLVYDSDIEIIHTPGAPHAQRDLAAFRKAIDGGHVISDSLFKMYAKELYMGGEDSDLLAARDYFCKQADEGRRGTEEIQIACIIAARAARLAGDLSSFMKYSMKNVAAAGCSETCCELGNYYLDHDDPEEASLWFYNALTQTVSLLDIHTRGDVALRGLAASCRKLGDLDQAAEFEDQAQEWTMQEGIS